MAESSKLKILRVLEIMKKTDEWHPLTATEIVRKLAGHGIEAERKSVSRDLAFLEAAGYSIKRCEDHNRGYYMTDHLFEDHELKLLCDAVNAAPFLTAKDSELLRSKILDLATPEGEALIDATSFVDNSIKSEDRQNKIKLDTLVRAIKSRKKVSLKYYTPGRDNRRIPRGGGAVYAVSPYYLVLNHNAYYLIGNPSYADNLRHFKVEMMSDLEMLEERVRDPRTLTDHGANFDLAGYVRQSINMWGGELVDIRLRCDHVIRDSVRTQFGRNLWITAEDDRRFTVLLKVTDSSGLYQWLAQYGECIEVLSPDHVRQRLVSYLTGIADRHM